jgi:hypothetical protein
VFRGSYEQGRAVLVLIDQNSLPKRKTQLLSNHPYTLDDSIPEKKLLRASRSI